MILQTSKQNNKDRKKWHKRYKKIKSNTEILNEISYGGVFALSVWKETLFSNTPKQRVKQNKQVIQWNNKITNVFLVIILMTFGW